MILPGHRLGLGLVWVSFNLARQEAAEIVAGVGRPIEDLCPLSLTGRV